MAIIATDRELDAAAQALAMVHPASEDYVESNPALAPMIGRPGWQSLVQPFVDRIWPSRFGDGTFGVYYSGDSLGTALGEALYHRTLLFRRMFLRLTHVTLHCHAAHIEGPMHDILGRRSDLSSIYDAGDPPAAYAASQPFGRSLYDRGSNGLAYDSVRHERGRCVAVFRPVPILHSARLYARIVADWNGAQFVETTTEVLP